VAADSAVVAAVAAIVAEVMAGGDEALAEIEKRLGDPTPAKRVLSRDQLGEALERCDPELRSSLEFAAENVRLVAEAQLQTGGWVVLPQGQTVETRIEPVSSAAVYAPGGRASYPSTVVMGCVPAKVAGVERLVVTSPPGADGTPAGSMLAAAALVGADEFVVAGGAQAIAALACGTQTVQSVDVIAGPGNAYVQEAKRQLFGTVGIDSIAGPSEVVAIADASADPGLVALDLAAQAEHGPDSPARLIVVGADVAPAIVSSFEACRAKNSGPLTVSEVSSVEEAVELINEIAPEHLELHCEYAAEVAKRVGPAGAVFYGEGGSAVFGDYVAGSNHILPTGTSARFSGPLWPATFQRRQALVSLPAEAARELAPHVEVIAGAEGFPIHVQSAKARAEDRQ